MRVLKRLVLLAAILTASIALSPAAASRLRDPMAPVAGGVHAGHQHGDPGQTSAESATLTGAVNGAETPEAVPDEDGVFSVVPGAGQ